ncbi:BREX-1 system phosphatase PglZ type A [Bifidobacterium sp. 82T24]|uniref:BREX-1 system phosphatase PglZ type A n=1 Tax=Bifidobacterium pluvialisilvae TaxID=2834436 RepID=UPI001C5757A6|nr:BREX-1 system phosphatase PglZ type A [Bifidobacterium pluvialisilvae]MBW3088261.1 BREX-1 system phosphatase PglZ type A [Bifidobacterium pluvialisilvae]
MGGNKQLGSLLAARFGKYAESESGEGRIVFWEDDEGAYADTVETLIGPTATSAALRDVELIRLTNANPFGVKYRVLREQPDTKFLIYRNAAEPGNRHPDDEHNWLLDLELAYGPVFSADRLMLILNETMPKDAGSETRDAWLDVMRRTKPFFDDDGDVNTLAERMSADDDARTMQAKMIAVLLNLPVGRNSLQDIWRRLLEQYAEDDDSGIESIRKAGLLEFHWKGTTGIYRYAAYEESEAPIHPQSSLTTAPAGGSGSVPTVKDFVLWLFKLAWNDFSDGDAGPDRYANIRRDFEGWRNDRTFTDTFKQLSEQVFDELMLSRDIVAMPLKKLVRRSLFSEVDEQIVTLLYQEIGNETIADDDVQAIIRERTPHIWYDDYRIDYEAIGAASRLRAMLDEGEGIIDDIDSPGRGFSMYAQRLYQADQAYREFIRAWKRQGRRAEASAIRDDLELRYSRFQSRLGETWQRQIDRLDHWGIDDVPAQQDFYRKHVRKTVDGGRKIAIIISDALRYEVAQSFADRMRSQNRWNATVEAQLGVLPSYTQLGMAALLPHKTLAFSTNDHYSVLVDGMPSQGMGNRNAILAKVGGAAVDDETLMGLNREGSRELVKSHKVLYVFHNTIDHAGEGDEAATFGACERAIVELDGIVKKLANANVTNMIVTADHGFLYQDHDVADGEWLSEQPKGDAVWQRKRRFVIGSNLAESPSFTTFTASQLGIEDAAGEGVSVQVPVSIHRLRKQGGGVRYVHGGASLQEIVVPVVRISKGRSAAQDVRPVEFRILQRTDRITTGQLTVEFQQTEPVGDKVAQRTVFAGLYGVGGGEAVPISNEVPLTFRSESPEARDRHVAATFLLTSEADRFNDTMVELRLSERIAGSNQRRMLEQKADYLLKRSLFADDGFDF